jgi:ribonucleoside-diphosphate reductase alpha chain
MLHRPVGMGCMGWFDVLVKNGIVYDSAEAEDFVDNLMEFISYHAIDASVDLAAERGKYKTYEGSLWDQGRLPIDTWKELAEWKGADKWDNETFAGETLKWDTTASMDWQPVRDKLKEHGIRNSHVMAIAPNASIAYILGCEQSIEPMTRLVRPYKNKSGNIMISNSHFVEDMKKEGLWCPELAKAILEADGDVGKLTNIPDKYKELYKTAYNRDQFSLIRVNARRQKWIDQAISFNLYNNRTSKKYINDIYMYANKMGLKTTYYFRNLSASDTKIKIEKAVDQVPVEAPTPEQIQACSLDAMENGGECVMCE